MNKYRETPVATYSMIAAQILLKRAAASSLSATDFYAQSGISQPTWSRILRGQGRLSLEDLHRCADIVSSKFSIVTKEIENAEAVLRANGVKIIEPVSPHHRNDLAEAGKVIIAAAALAFLVSQVLKK